jgi:ATP-dependent protease HslVU (ClpYQ) peptidase subunit
MTTVAYRDGVIVGDGLCTGGGHITSRNYLKIIATETHLAGISGEADYGSKFLEWVKHGCDERKIPQNVNKATGDIDAFIVDRKGIVTAYGEGMLPMKLGKLPFYAIGSGWAYATGAMEMGADAEKAVRISAKFDAHTGGRIRKLTFK